MRLPNATALYFGRQGTAFVRQRSSQNRPRKRQVPRVINGIEKYDRLAEEEILLVLRSCDPLNEQTALEYIRKIMQTKSPVRKMLGLPEVYRV